MRGKSGAKELPDRSARHFLLSPCLDSSPKRYATAKPILFRAAPAGHQAVYSTADSGSFCFRFGVSTLLASGGGTQAAGRRTHHRFLLLAAYSEPVTLFGRGVFLLRYIESVALPERRRPPRPRPGGPFGFARRHVNRGNPRIFLRRAKSCGPLLKRRCARISLIAAVPVAFFFERLDSGRRGDASPPLRVHGGGIQSFTTAVPGTPFA